MASLTVGASPASPRAQLTQSPLSSMPPGPKGHFLSGHLPEFRRDPLGFVTRCAREYGDVVPFRFGPAPAILLSHPDLIEEVLVTQHQHFTRSRVHRAMRSLSGDGLLSSDGDLWRRERRLMQPQFHRERVVGYGAVMVQYVERLLATWHDGEVRDLREEMMQLTMEIAAKTLFDANVAGDAAEVGAALTIALEELRNQVNS